MADNELPPVTHDVPDESEERRGIPSWLKMAGVFVVLTGSVAALLGGSDAGDAFVYSKLVHEVTADPAAFEGRELRVEGDLRQGSVQFREDPCEWRFIIEKKGEALPVRFPQCVVPDTFRDDYGISVTAQGRLESDGTFLADQVVPRCPSKYEMKQKEAAGEEMPHDYPTGPQESP
ncbi:MAG: cytochrome c maturation protein CcmE [Myxococcota bacterium]